MRLYLDGLEVAQGTQTGGFANWGDYFLALANQPSVDRPWLGELHLVASYDRALDAAEVDVNFAAGPSTAPPVPLAPSIVTPPSDQSLLEVTAASQDSLMVTYTDPPLLRFDLNTAASPTEPGYTGVGTTNPFDAGLFYGWTITSPTSELTGPETLNRDFHFGMSDNMFRTAVTPGGTFDVKPRFFHIGGFDVDAKDILQHDEVRDLIVTDPSKRRTQALGTIFSEFGEKDEE